MSKKVAIVGAGGGYRGIAEIGFLNEIIPLLIEMKISAEDLFLFGVSVSALNFSILATAQEIKELPSKFKELSKQWKLIQAKGPKAVFDVKIRKAWNSSSLLSSDPLFKLLDGFRAEEAVKSPITFGCFVRNDDTKEYEILRNHDPYFKKHPLEFLKVPIASASLPPYFPRIRIGQYNYCDGGYITLAPAIEAGCKIIFVLFPYPEKYNDPIISPFIQKHLALILNIISDAAAVLRDKDHDALVSAYEYNWRSVLEKNAIHQTISAVEKQPHIAPYLFGDLTQKVLKNLKSLQETRNNPSSITQKELLDSLVKVIPIYAEPPRTLTVSSFKNQDFDIVIEKAKVAARRICENLQLLKLV